MSQFSSICEIPLGSVCDPACGTERGFKAIPKKEELALIEREKREKGGEEYKKIREMKMAKENLDAL